MRTQRRGFTLIELLVVITILMMLMTLLLPAIFKAKTWVVGMMVKGRITALRNACDSYYQIFNGYPGVVENPPGTGGSPTNLSGAQNLVLALFGCSRTGTTYTPEYRGPGDPIDRYADTLTRKYEPFFNPKPGELIGHNEVLDRDKSQDGSYCLPDGTSPKVIVDYLLSPPRVLLYYRQLPRYVDANLYQFDDNAVYCIASKGETSGNWTSTVTNAAKKSTPGFIIVSAGPDRIYFNSDDFSNVAY